MVSRIVAKVVLLCALLARIIAAQTAPPQKDIPAIAKDANGAIVSIVMSDKGGKPVTQGSGFFVSKEGLVVTNYHVISEGISAIVKLPDGGFYVVDGVLASDKARDIAVIKAHGQNFRTLALGNSDRVQIGEEVVAIGNPLSLESTVSNGIVSGIRAVQELGGKFLQVTAPISPGSSGGPLFNMAGEVIGITTLNLRGGENLNFAIPVNDAKMLLKNQSTALHNLPNESPTKTPVAKKRDPNTPVATIKEPSLSESFVSAAITAINSLDTPAQPLHSLAGEGNIVERRDALLHDIRNIADVEKDKNLRGREQIAYFDIALAFINFKSATKALWERTKQIVISRNVHALDAVDLAADEPEYCALRDQGLACAAALKEQLRDGYRDQPAICADPKPLQAYRESVLCHSSLDKCGSQP